MRRHPAHRDIRALALETRRLPGTVSAVITATAFRCAQALGLMEPMLLSFALLLGIGQDGGAFAAQSPDRAAACTRTGAPPERPHGPPLLASADPWPHSAKSPPRLFRSKRMAKCNR